MTRFFKIISLLCLSLIYSSFVWAELPTEIELWAAPKNVDHEVHMSYDRCFHAIADGNKGCIKALTIFDQGASSIAQHQHKVNSPAAKMIDLPAMLKEMKAGQDRLNSAALELCGTAASACEATCEEASTIAAETISDDEEQNANHRLIAKKAHSYVAQCNAKFKVRAAMVAGELGKSGSEISQADATETSISSEDTDTAKTDESSDPEQATAKESNGFNHDQAMNMAMMAGMQGMSNMGKSGSSGGSSSGGSNGSTGTIRSTAPIGQEQTTTQSAQAATDPQNTIPTYHPPVNGTTFATASTSAATLTAATVAKSQQFCVNGSSGGTSSLADCATCQHLNKTQSNPVCVNNPNLCKTLTPAQVTAKQGSCPKDPTYTNQSILQTASIRSPASAVADNLYQGAKSEITGSMGQNLFNKNAKLTSVWCQSVLCHSTDKKN